MTGSTARVLALLELLQLGGVRTVADLAGRLDVDERTVRRSVAQLVELGIPVDSIRGRYGGYRLAPGYRMPPLIFTDDEALAVLLGLVAGQRSELFRTSAVASESAGAKIRRVLPDTVRRRLDALLDTAAFHSDSTAGSDTEAAVLLDVAQAARARHPVDIVYIDKAGRRTERTLHPYGVVARSGRWYVSGSDSVSGELRTFRLDRISAIAPTPGTFDVPPDFDAVTTVVDSLANTPWTHSVSIRVRDDVPHVRRYFPAGLATVTELGQDAGWVRVTLNAERLDWIPPLLAALDRPSAVEHPAELRDLLRASADRLRDSADRE